MELSALLKCFVADYAAVYDDDDGDDDNGGNDDDDDQLELS